MIELGGSLDRPTKYINLGPITISIPSLLMFSLILLLFIALMVIGNLKIRHQDGKSDFIAKWRHINNSVSVASLIIVIASGMIMASRGLSWLYKSNVSFFMHGLHFWSVQIFFISIILHFMLNFWTSTWQGRAFAMWTSGVVAFFTCMFTAYTGGLVASSLNSQWIALQSKNVFNSLGVGALFNPLNVGQMLTLHVAIFPIIVSLIVVWHIALVQHRVFHLPWINKEVPEIKK